MVHRQIDGYYAVTAADVLQRVIVNVGLCVGYSVKEIVVADGGVDFGVAVAGEQDSHGGVEVATARVGGRHRIVTRSINREGLRGVACAPQEGGGGVGTDRREVCDGVHTRNRQSRNDRHRNRIDGQVDFRNAVATVNIHIGQDNLLAFGIGDSIPDEGTAHGCVKGCMALRIDVKIDGRVIAATVLVLKVERVGYHSVVR